MSLLLLVAETVKKHMDMSSENLVLLDFTKYLGFSEVQKNGKVVNVSIIFQEEKSLF